MAKIIGTEVNLGIGIESTPGTAVSATFFPKWLDFSMQAVSEKAHFMSQRGLRNESSNSMIRRKYAQGSVSIVPDIEAAPYFFSLALGSKASATAAGETIVYEHTFTVQNAGASMKTATILAEQGAIETTRYANCVVDALNIEVSDSYAKMSADIIGAFPDTGTVTESYTQQTEFAYHNMTAKFGTSLANAAGQSATPLKSFKLNIANNVKLDDAFLSGQNTPVAGGFIAGRLKVTGSYSLHFSDTTELAKYKANTKNAMLVSFQGAAIGNAETEEILIKLGRLVLTKPPMEYKLDGLVILNQEFQVEYDSTDKEITVVVTNLNTGSNY